MTSRTHIGAAAVAALLATTAPAAAQDLFGEPTGIRVSDRLVLSPRAYLHTAYQTNVFRQDGGDGAGPIGSPIARLGVGATIGTESDARAQAAGEQGGDHPAVSFYGDLALTWHQYLSADVHGQDDLAVAGVADVVFNPKGSLSLGLRDGYVRSVTPPAVVSGDNLDHSRNNLQVTGTFRPGGDALAVYARYQFDIDFFEKDSASFANRTFHTFALGANWRWLPKTRIEAEASYGIVSPNDTSYKPGSSPLRAWAGIASLITPRIGAVLRAGYANGFYDAGPSFSTYLATAEVRYAAGPTVHTAFGYQHDAHDSVIANYFTEHRIYARAAAQVAGRWNVELKAGLPLRSYDFPDAPGMPVTFGGATFCSGGSDGCNRSDRFDVVAQANAAVTYRATTWLDLGASYTLDAVSTDAFIQTDDGDRDSGAYVSQEFVVSATGRM